jgi:hypothetical protein
MLPNMLAESIMLLTCIQKAVTSNLGPLGTQVTIVPAPDDR